MTEVDNILSTIFCAVPAFILVEPVMTSGPTFTSIGYCAKFDINPLLTQQIDSVVAPIKFAYLIPPITYGVRPEAAKPQTTSCSVNSIFSKSSLASS